MVNDVVNICMIHCLPIEGTDNQLSLCYLKAAHYLASISSTAVSIDTLWKQKFNATVDLKKKIIIFDKEQDKTLFLLQWS